MFLSDKGSPLDPGVHSMSTVRQRDARDISDSYYNYIVIHTITI